MRGSWRLRISEEAERDMERLPRRVKLEAVDLIDSLREDPFQHNAEELRRNDKVYRIYLGGKGYRLIYRVNDHKREVLVGRIRPRGEAYKGLRNP